jgi:putative NADH-flavin reductase
MRLTVFGATGGTGSELVRQALEEGNDVTAVVRDPARLAVPAHERLRVVTADVTDPVAIAPAVEGADSVVSSLGHRGGGPATICEDGTRAIIEAMGKQCVRRLLVVSAAGLAADRGDGLFVRYVVKPLILQPLLKNGFADKRRCEDEVRASDLDWTIVRPPQLTDKPLTGRYRTAYGQNLRGGAKISRADVAHLMLAVLDQPSAVRAVMGVAY